MFLQDFYISLKSFENRTEISEQLLFLPVQF
jgi:hypothetical protein